MLTLEDRLKAYNAELFCCIQLNYSDIFKCQLADEGPITYFKTDIWGKLKNDEKKEIRFQVKNRKAKYKPNKIIFPQCLKRNDIELMEKFAKHTNIPYFIVCFDSNKKVSYTNNPGYIISIGDVISQLNNTLPDWRTKRKDKAFKIEIPLKKKLSKKRALNGILMLLKQLEETQDASKEAIKRQVKSKIHREKSKLSQEDFIYLKSLKDNPSIKQAYEQIKEEYYNLTYVNDFITKEFIPDNDIEYLSYHIHFKYPRSYYDEKNMYTFYDGFGRNIAYIEINTLFDMIENNDNITKTSINNFNKKIPKIIKDAIDKGFKKMFVHNNKMVELGDIFEKEYKYKDNGWFIIIDDKEIEIIYIYSEILKDRLLLFNKNSILYEYKKAKDTDFYNDIKYPMEFGDQNDRFDFRYYLTETDVGIIARTVGAFKILNPDEVIMYYM